MTQPSLLSLSPTLPALEHVISSRQAVLDEVRRAHEALSRAHLALKALDITCRLEVTSQRTAVSVEGCTDDELARALGLDRDIWLKLHRSTLLQVQTSTQREAQQRALYNGDFPPVSAQTIMETLTSYHEAAPDAFVQSVYDLWARLHTRYASNNHASFGPRQVVTYACEGLCSQGRLYLRRYGSEPLTDLIKLIGMYDHLGTSLSLRDIPNSWSSMRRTFEPGVWQEFGAFKIKLFKNGNMHLVMSEPLREAMNKTLATAAGRRLHDGVR